MIIESNPESESKPSDVHLREETSVKLRIHPALSIYLSSSNSRDQTNVMLSSMFNLIYELSSTGLFSEGKDVPVKPGDRQKRRSLHGEVCPGRIFCSEKSSGNSGFRIFREVQQLGQLRQEQL